MKQIKYIVPLLFVILSLGSCGLDENEPYDLKFIHIMLDGASSTTVNYKAKTIATYPVYLSSASFNESVELTYEIIVGNGLKAGVDFNLITTGNTLVFLPGIYDMPIRVQWLPNPIDPTKDNTLRIKLISNNKGYSVGLPGPDKLQSEFLITKVQ